MSKDNPNSGTYEYTLNFYACSCTPVHTRVKKWWLLTKTVTTYKHNPKCRVHNTPTKKESSL